MRQGTVSVLVGCHSIVHSLLVIRGWKLVYGRYPEFWQIVCILVHDIGHWGLDYIDDPSKKNEHWRLGAQVAGWLYGSLGIALTAGHCSKSGFPMSEMRLPDKYSWVIAPNIWLWLNCVFEPKLQRPGMSKWNSGVHWKRTMTVFIKEGQYKTQSSHDLYIEDWGLCKEKRGDKGG